MTKELGFEHGHWKDTLTSQDKRAMRFPSAGASLSLGELSHGSFLPCAIQESSEIFVAVEVWHDQTILCRLFAKTVQVAAESIDDTRGQ